MNHSTTTLSALALLFAGAVSGSSAAEPPTTGPVAVYWISAATTTGMGGMGGMPGAGGPGMGRPGMGQGAGGPPGRPGLGSMMGMMMGRGGGEGGGYGGRGGYGGGPGMGRPGMGAMGGGGASHTLTLQLGSTQRASGEPEAAHLPPEGLGAGDNLPLVTPNVAPPEPAEPGEAPKMTQRPRGRMLIYWGCGEHAAAPPIVIDFSKIGPNMPVPNIPFVIANPGRPPSPGRYATYGQWPNERSASAVPPEGSLVGAHSVKGNYSPEIRFSLGQDQDFLAPLDITDRSPTAEGGTHVAWSPVAGATGYYAWLVGAQDRGETVVMWSSGASANMMGGALADYLPPAEVRRLIAQHVVMGPDTTECVVPEEVIKASPFGMLSMIAYGEETNLADPPRPRDPKAAWNIRWTVKVRRKSTTGVLLGMPGGGGRPF
jgi:hypothetical protein